jgi:hypothetical protein
MNKIFNKGEIIMRKEIALVAFLKSGGYLMLGMLILVTAPIWILTMNDMNKLPFGNKDNENSQEDQKGKE